MLLHIRVSRRDSKIHSNRIRVPCARDECWTIESAILHILPRARARLDAALIVSALVAVSIGASRYGVVGSGRDIEMY